ncbi:PqiC family protein [Pseudomonas oryzihabitans]|uniref:ABC-type transport auxiliary lipoprotein component domain-containing protein n=1 Tax=Pseudomonas oryzihabitans TaxID=47885 RepID=A0A178LBD0_9PSED|nr:ABC-type transport auxiliary lipoprotein family protein [Pseudomonas oryzihabitans]OAN27122.1 hypothetical protein A4V15_22105 [Pseudomonas oryzihabitans]
MKRICLARLALVGLLAGLGGCASLGPSHYYQLDGGSARAPASSERGLAVWIESLQLADYLQRDVLLERQPDGSLKTTGDHWAGPLNANVRQLLQRQLASRLNSGRVVVGEQPAGFDPQYRVELVVTRLDAGDQAPAALDASWQLRDGQGRLLDSEVVHLQARHAGDRAAQVRAQSELLQQLAARLATDLTKVAQRGRRGAEVARKEPKKLVEEAQARPTLPAVVPIRTGAEVYRF